MGEGLQQKSDGVPLSIVSDIKPAMLPQRSQSNEIGEYQTFKNTYFYRSYLAWNNLPFELRKITNPKMFKTKLKKHIWKEIWEQLINETNEEFYDT